MGGTGDEGLETDCRGKTCLMQALSGSDGSVLRAQQQEPQWQADLGCL